MDKLWHHKRLAEEENIEAASATHCFLPPCGSGFNANEKMFLRIDLMLRKVGKCPVVSLWDLIGRLVNSSS